MQLFLYTKIFYGNFIKIYELQVQLYKGKNLFESNFASIIFKWYYLSNFRVKHYSFYQKIKNQNTSINKGRPNNTYKTCSRFRTVFYCLNFVIYRQLFYLVFE